VRGISAIAHDLVSSQTRLERALTEEVQTNTRLAEALQGSTSGVANSARALGEIEGKLAGLRDEFARMADGTSGQARTLNDLLEQQASVATGLSQVARDISTISLRTAQRQEDVSRDVAALVDRLDRVSRGMGPGVAPEPVEGAARRDPESGWPRRRS
jgi:chromosome segregation ATPase